VTLSAADRVEILDIVGRADAAASRRDAEAYADLFTEDAVLDGSQGRHPGAALRSSVGPIWAAEGPATLHLTLNPVVDPGEGPDEAVVSSILLIVDRLRPSRSAPQRPSPRCCAAPVTPGASAGEPSPNTIDYVSTGADLG
jgi:hypothetical protein